MRVSNYRGYSYNAADAKITHCFSKAKNSCGFKGFFYFRSMKKRLTIAIPGFDSAYRFIGTPINFSMIQTLKQENFALRWRNTNQMLSLPQHRILGKLGKSHAHLELNSIEQSQHSLSILSNYMSASYRALRVENFIYDEIELLEWYIKLRQNDVSRSESMFHSTIINNVEHDVFVPSMVALPFLTMIMRTIPTDIETNITAVFENSKNSTDEIYFRVDAPNCYLFNYSDEIGSLFPEAALVIERQQILRDALGMTYHTKIHGDNATSREQANQIRKKIAKGKRPSVSVEMSIPVLTQERLISLGIISTLAAYQTEGIREL